MKKRILLILVILAISLPFVPVTAQITVTPDPGTGNITPKEKDRYELTSAHSDDRVYVDISGSPAARVYKWGREAYLDISYSSLAVSPAKELDSNKVIWRDGDVEIHQYLGDSTEQFEDGVFEFEVILHSKPASNQIILDIETEGLVFYYQPELTAEEIANGDTRPGNIVGSYAVYHESKRDNKYKTGKAFHIPRPQPIDAENKTVWADLLIENGQMIVTIPQKFLDEAVYPIRHATGATFGYTIAGNSDAAVGADFLFASSATFSPEFPGTVISMSAYIKDSGDAFRLGLYESDDSFVMGTNEANAGAAQEWVTSNFTANITVSPNTEYRLVVWGSDILEIAFDQLGDPYYYDAESYPGAWPDPAVWLSAGNHQYSIYVTYDPVLPGTEMRQGLIGGTLWSPSTSVDNFNGLNGGWTWQATEGAWRKQLVTISGQLSNLMVELVPAPGGDGFYTFIVTVNGNETALSTTISGSSTLGSDRSSIVSVSAGDTVSLKVTPGNNPTGSVRPRWTLLFTGETRNESLILGAGLTSQGDTVYTPISQTAIVNTSEFFARQVMPTAGAIENLFVELSASPGGGGKAYGFKLRLNGANTTLATTITGNAVTGNNTTDEVAVAAGDVVSFQINPVDTPTDALDVAFGMTFVADIDGESIILGGGAGILSDTDTLYNRLHTGTKDNSWTGTEYTQLAQSSTLKKLYVLFNGIPPEAGKSYIISVMEEGVPTDLAVTISDNEISGNNTSDTATISDWSEVSLQSVPVNSPARPDVYWGLVSVYATPVQRILNISVDGKVLVSP